MVYWIATSLIAIMLGLSAGTYLFDQNTIEGVRALGFPDFFRIELAVLKLLAIPVLLLPRLPTRLKEWAHAGVAFYLITAIVAHHVHDDPIVLNLINMVFCGILIISNKHLPRKPAAETTG